MTNRRYFLVLLDPSGRSVRRFAVSRELLQGVTASVGIFVLTLLIVLGHGLYERSTAREAEQLARDNAAMRELTAHLTQRLPEARLQALQADLTFAQIWARSGLGLSPRILGVGPVEGEASPLIAESADMMPAQLGSGVLQVEPAALTLELERIEGDGLAVQQSLGELLEYFHDAALLLSNTPSVKPVDGGYLTSSFGKRRDPMHGQWKVHKGLDIGGRIGLQILAPADGVVVSAGPRGGYGNTIVIDHGYGMQTHYAHLSRFKCRRGDRVHRGDVIAEMGNSGRSTGPHLHYEVRRHGQPLNPTNFVLD
jgi:murein DD-endopeptidase MepM/ murein hydrolase activator NlpD